ncbi:MAG: hypothetical protein EPO11_00750 [Gammaproteobacteria bacterium]|nr:MAG: hypothetical protein EPO11_00750 [Gammaproteobacteria bacterium]
MLKERFFRLFISTNPISNIQKLLFLSILLTSFFLFTSLYHLEPGGYLFIEYANALAFGKDHLTPNVSVRDIGYPLLLWMSGYPYHQSLIGIALINAIMAMLIPPLIYLITRPVLPKGSYYIALATIFSLSPFYYIKWIHHDHPYIFFTVLSLFFLCTFIDKKKSTYLYAMTFTVIIASLIRPAGNLFFIFFIATAFIFVRGSLLRYMICCIIAVLSLTIYTYHRHDFFDQYKPLQTYNGGQLFYNLYLNSTRYGITLSPELGPNMKKITDSLYQSTIKLEETSQYEKFLKLYVYPYNTNEFIKRVYTFPARYYLEMLYRFTKNDQTFMKASLEIIQKYPWYPFAYTARNSWYLLYKPGYAHTKYDINLFGKSNIQDAYPFDSKDELELTSLSDRALRELDFDNFEHKPHIAFTLIHYVKSIFCKCYLFFTKLMFYLMTISWIAVFLKFGGRFFLNDKWKNLIELTLANKLDTYITVLTLYLFQSILMVAALVDPILRFHNHLIPFKIILASFGLVILIRLIKSSSHQTNLVTDTMVENIIFSKRQKIISIFLLLLATVLLISWSEYIIVNTK